MSLSNKEQMAMYIFVIILILALGVGFLVYPEAVQRWPANKAELALRQDENRQMDGLLVRESTIDNEIAQVYFDGEKAAKTFYPEMTAVDADNALRDFLKKQGITPDSLSVVNPSLRDFTVVASGMASAFPEYQIQTYANVDTSQLPIPDTVAKEENGAEVQAPTTPAAISADEIKLYNQFWGTISPMTEQEAVQYFVTTVNELDETQKRGNLVPLVSAMSDYMAGVSDGVPKSQTVGEFDVSITAKLTDKEYDKLKMAVFGQDKLMAIISMNKSADDSEITSAAAEYEITIAMYCVKPLAKTDYIDYLLQQKAAVDSEDGGAEDAVTAATEEPVIGDVTAEEN